MKLCLTQIPIQRNKMSNYTEEQTAYMKEVYLQNPGGDTVDFLAEKYKKSKKSIIGKLSREGVYRREEYVTKTGDRPVTKIEMVAEIAQYLDVEVESLAGLEKAAKGTLKIILESLTKVL